MATLTKHFTLTNFFNYSDIDAIGSTKGMEKYSIHTSTAGHANVKITTWNDENGNGFETRKYFDVQA